MSGLLAQVAWYRFRATWRRRRGGYLALVLLIGLIGGVALGSLAAARRTQSSFATFLASTSPPDAMEIGNTDVAEFAASGGLENLASAKSSLPNASNWLSGLSGPAEYHGGLYAVPLLAGDRVVVYNKTMFKAAGIKSAPDSLDQLIRVRLSERDVRRPSVSSGLRSEPRGFGVVLC